MIVVSAVQQKLRAASKHPNKTYNNKQAETKPKTAAAHPTTL